MYTHPIPVTRSSITSASAPPPHPSLLPSSPAPAPPAAPETPPDREFIDYKTSMITDSEPRGLLFCQDLGSTHYTFWEKVDEGANLTQLFDRRLTSLPFDRCLTNLTPQPRALRCPRPQKSHEPVRPRALCTAVPARGLESHLQTLIIHNLGFNQNY